jgi:uncharacterized protein
MTSIERVQQMYGAFGRGEIPAILAALADDVEWEYNAFPNPVPWLQPRKGRAEVAKFFEALAAVQFTQFEPKHFFAAGNMVVSVIDETFTVKATGKTVIEPEAIHIWHFDAAGRVAKMRHRADTWQHAHALKGD